MGRSISTQVYDGEECGRSGTAPSEECKTTRNVYDSSGYGDLSVVGQRSCLEVRTHVVYPFI